jgi:ferredoxin-NADP reductase/Na+-translocating ferredoxin:NAD+ oxidoreductase RnfD subunit
MLRLIDEILNKVTIYRIVLYYLIFLVVVADVLSFFGLIPYNFLDIAINLLVAVLTCGITNHVFAKLFKAFTNFESSYITALILVLIIPVKSFDNLLYLIGASFIAMASKYLLTIERRHIFNPAAASVAAIYLLSPTHTATWWVGTQAMFPFVLLGGLLVLRKIQRETMVLSFLSVYLIIIAFDIFLQTSSVSAVINSFKISFVDSALFFFMFVMLTEPLTSPTTEKLQIAYGSFVGLLYTSPQLRLIPFAVTPELALCIGNIFSYIISPNFRFLLPLLSKIQLSHDTYAFYFSTYPGFNFIPGQYMEWTLPHKNSDSRGVRRYFSIASSPTENIIMLTVKFYEPSSTYKRHLLTLKQGDKIIASQLAGDFTLPKDISKPISFIAGGVGIAPFRSMVKYIIDKNLKVDIVILYSNREKQDILFADIFSRATQNGVRTIYTLTDLENIPSDWTGEKGHIDEEMIKRQIPDFKNRTFYLSGPQLMVKRFRKILLDMGLSKNKIKTDFFPGYEEK